MTTTAGSRATPKERASVIMASPATGHRTLSAAAAAATGGISDPVIDEHFRRSLGKDYMNVFAPAVAQRQQQQAPATAAAAPSIDGDDDDDAGLSGIYLKCIIRISCLLCTVPVLPIEFTFRYITNKTLAKSKSVAVIELLTTICLLWDSIKNLKLTTLLLYILINSLYLINSNWLHTFCFQKKKKNICIYLNLKIQL